MGAVKEELTRELMAIIFPFDKSEDCFIETPGDFCAANRFLPNRNIEFIGDSFDVEMRMFESICCDSCYPIFYEGKAIGYVRDGIPYTFSQ